MAEIQIHLRAIQRTKAPPWCVDDTQAPDQILLDKLFTEADIDGNGEVDFEEFSILYERVKSGELESFGLTNTVNLTARFLGSFFDTADSDEES